MIAGSGWPNAPPTTGTMHADTIAALRALAVALATHPTDRDALDAYGHLPTHLADAIEDHLPDDE